jgi:hypothetical protein
MQDEDATRQRLRSALGDLNIRWPQALSPLEEKRAESGFVLGYERPYILKYQRGSALRRPWPVPCCFIFSISVF